MKESKHTITQFSRQFLCSCYFNFPPGSPTIPAGPVAPDNPVGPTFPGGLCCPDTSCGPGGLVIFTRVQQRMSARYTVLGIHCELHHCSFPIQKRTLHYETIFPETNFFLIFLICLYKMIIFLQFQYCNNHFKK